MATAPRRQPSSGRSNNSSVKVILDSQAAIEAAQLNNDKQLSILIGLVEQTVLGLHPGGSWAGQFSQGGSTGGGVPTGHPGPGGGQRPAFGGAPDGTYPGGQGYGMQGLRQKAAAGINSAYGTASGSVYRQNPDQSVTEFKTNGTTVRHDPGVIDDAELAAGIGRARIGSMVGHLAEGDATGLLKAVPYVAAPIMGAEAVWQGANWVANQRQQNSQYQAIYGGSNMGTGLSNRLDQYGFQLKSLFSGGMDWSDSSQAFHDVSSLGVSGNTRSNDLSTMQTLYTKLGVSVKDSFNMVQQATQNLNTSLTGLVANITTVSNAATSNGMSAQYGRQLNSSNYAQLSNAYGADPTGTLAGMSAILTKTELGMGRSLSAQANLAGMLSQKGQIALMAKSINVDPTTFEGLMSQGDPGGYVARAIDNNLATASMPTGMDAAVTADMRRIMRSKGYTPGQPLPSGDLSEVASELMSDSKPVNGGKGNGLNASLVLNNYNNRGMGFTSDQSAMDFWVRMANGQVNVSATENQVKTTHANAKDAMGPQYRGRVLRPVRSQGNWQNKGVNPTIDAALSAYKGKQVQVTINGQKRVMDIADAAKYAPDQIGKGTAIVENEGGKTLSELLGQHQSSVLTGKMSGSNYTLSDATNSALKGAVKGVGAASSKDSKSNLNSSKGVSVTAYEKAAAKSQAAEAKEVKGKIMVVPSPELATLLRYTLSGDVTLGNDAASAGATPLPGVSSP
jgi:hypothetical protein